MNEDERERTEIFGLIPGQQSYNGPKDEKRVQSIAERHQNLRVCSSSIYRKPKMVPFQGFSITSLVLQILTAYLGRSKNTARHQQEYRNVPCPWRSWRRRDQMRV